MRVHQVLSWQPDNLSLMLPGNLADGLATGTPQFFPRLDSIMVLLSRRVTAASAWAHILTVNAFAARHVFISATRARIPAVHSILLCLLAGPAGLACHMLTRAAVTAHRRSLRLRSGHAESVNDRHEISPRHRRSENAVDEQRD